MKITVHKPKGPKALAPYELKLVERSDGGVTLCLVDPDTGEEALAGSVLSIKPDGTVRRHYAVNTDERSPIKTDGSGRIALADRVD